MHFLVELDEGGCDPLARVGVGEHAAVVPAIRLGELVQETRAALLEDHHLLLHGQVRGVFQLRTRPVSTATYGGGGGESSYFIGNVDAEVAIEEVPQRVDEVERREVDAGEVGGEDRGVVALVQLLERVVDARRAQETTDVFAVEQLAASDSDSVSVCVFWRTTVTIPVLHEERDDALDGNAVVLPHAGFDNDLKAVDQIAHLALQQGALHRLLRGLHAAEPQLPYACTRIR